MQIKKAVFSVAAGFSGVIILLVAGDMVFGQGKAKEGQAHFSLEKALLENKQLQEAAAQAENKIAQLEALLQKKEQDTRNFGGIQGIKEALASAQITIAQLNKETEEARNAKEIAENKSMMLSSRCQSLTQELSRALEESKVIKRDLEYLKSKKDTETASINSSAKDNQIKSLQMELERLNNTKTGLEEKLAKLDSNSQAKEISRLQDELLSLKSRLFSAQGELNLSQSELSKIKYAPAGEGSFKQQSEEAKRLYENAKNQITQLSNIIGSKEMELANMRKELAALKDEAAASKKSLADVETNAKNSQLDSVRIKALESEKLTLEAKVTQAQNDLHQQNQLIASLSNAMEALNKKVAQKEEDKKALEINIAQLNAVKSSSDDEINKQKRRMDELNNFYSGLKSQIVQFSQFLNDKEIDIGEKNKEIARLQAEFAIQQSKINVLENELADTKTRQKNIVDNLSQAKDLNSALQNSLSDVSQSFNNKESLGLQNKEKAEELKRKIEMMLVPKGAVN